MPPDEQPPSGGLILRNGVILMVGGGFAGSRNCCCVSYFCYCYTRSAFYGSVLLERRVVCYRSPIWDDANQRWVFLDGQPCVGTSPAGSQGCTVTYEGITVKLCSCAGRNGDNWRWAAVDPLDPAAIASCSTIEPPP